MKPMRVLSIIGTRPEAVKMAPIVLRLAQTPGVESKVCVTGQHREMLDQVLDLFRIRPDVDLDLMRPDQSLAQITAAIFEHLDPVLQTLSPDWVLAQGDTTTVMAVSLAAYYNRLRFGHVEAGLRTADKWQPFPEELNRRVASIAADLHFAPTEWARQNLLKENVPPAHILVTGNPVIDALHIAASLPAPAAELELLQRLIGAGTGAPAQGAPGQGALAQGALAQGALAHPPRLVLVTAHRRENFGAPLESICAALKALAEMYAGRIKIVYPVHLNPNVQGPVYRLLEGVPHITLLPPLDYLPLVHLMKRATLVLTDSGGIQEEAPGLGVPVLVLREVTERPEGVQSGTVRLVGTDMQRIVGEARRLLDDPAAYRAMAKAANPYGDGHAAQRIVDALLRAG